MRASEVTLRAATTADVPAVLALVRSVLAEFDMALGEGAESDAMLERLPDAWTAHGGAFFVAELNGALVGTAAVERLPDGDFELQKMFLAPASRGHGVGRRLLDACVAVARTAGAHRVVLDTANQMTAAIAFYERAGFVRDDSVRRASRCHRGYRLDLR